MRSQGILCESAENAPVAVLSLLLTTRVNSFRSGSDGLQAFYNHDAETNSDTGVRRKLLLAIFCTHRCKALAHLTDKHSEKNIFVTEELSHTAASHQEVGTSTNRFTSKCSPRQHTRTHTHTHNICTCVCVCVLALSVDNIECLWDEEIPGVSSRARELV